MVGTFTKLVGPALYLGLSMYGYDLLNMLGFYLSSQQESAGGIEASAFGLAIFFNSILIFGFYYSVDEKIALASSIAFGAKRFGEVKQAFWQGVLTISLMILLYFGPVVYFSESLLVAIGITRDNARSCAWVLQRLFPIDVFRMFNEVIMTSVLAQGISNRFGLYATLNMLVSLAAGLAAHSWWGWGLEAWILCRAVHEVIMLVMVLPPYLTRTEPLTRGKIGVAELFKGYGSFLADTGKYLLSLYTEWIGCEVAIYFTGLTHDNVQIAAHTALANFACFVMNTGIGFSTVGRTRVNVLLGKGYHKAAKNFFIIYMSGCIALGLAFSSLLLLGRSALATVYTGDNLAAGALLSKLLGVYSVFLSLDFIFPFLFTICRSTNQVTLSIVLNLALLIGYCIAMDYYLIVVRLLSCLETVTNMYLTILAIFSILLARMFRLDWREVPTDGLELELD